MAATATEDSGTRSAARRSARRSWATGSSLLPMAVFSLFFIYPIVYAVYISRYDWGVLGKIDSVGTQNYRYLVARQAVPASAQEHRYLHGLRRPGGRWRSGSPSR